MEVEFLFLYCFILFRAVRADCGVVSKEDWDMRPAAHVEYMMRPVSLVIIRHTVSANCNTDMRCAEIFRAMKNCSMKQLHHWDIGASFLVGGNGKIYEGAGWIHVGAHTVGYSRNSIGINFVGQRKDVPTRDSLEAVKSLLKCGVDNGHLTPDYKVVTHKQLTDSSDSKLYNEITSWPQWLEDISTINI